MTSFKILCGRNITIIILLYFSTDICKAYIGYLYVFHVHMTK